MEVQTWRSLLSMASRCGWMRMGLRWSLTRDSAMSVDSLYSSFASSCRRKWVDFLTLQWEEPVIENLWAHSHIRYIILIIIPAALGKRHQDGHLIMGVLSKSNITWKKFDFRSAGTTPNSAITGSRAVLYPRPLSRWMMKVSFPNFSKVS